MNSMEAELAQKEGYPAFMSAEHIALVLRKPQPKKEQEEKEAYESKES